MEILRMRVTWLVETDLAELEPAENMTDVTLIWWSGPSIEEVLSVLKRWHQLHRLTLNNQDKSVPQLELLGDFIMEMKHLSYLHIPPHFDPFSLDSNRGQLEILRDKVNEMILPRRPNFKFDISHYVE